MIAKCPCQFCGVNIEFDTREFLSGTPVACPECGLETILFVTEEAAKAKVEADKAKKDAELEMIKERVANRANSMMIYSNLDTLELRGDTITITKRGLANALASGMNGARTIQISSITAVQMKPAGMITPGYILFSYAGSKPFMGGVWEATQDPDTFLFGEDLSGEVAEFKAKVEKKMRDSKQAASSNNASGSITDELRKLAEFKQQGILSQEEFDAAKKKLLK
jgi:predicted  nucleic acid-binding Zn-ribbon protein